MKFKSFIFMICLSLGSTGFSANHHQNPRVNQGQSESAGKQIQAPYACEIEILNHSFDDVEVYGVFDDGSNLNPFIAYRFDAPHYISLYYSGYCHEGMRLRMQTTEGHFIYSGYTPKQSSILILPRCSGGVSVEVK